ncbi:MAG: TonB-dependent receptor, partial [Terriglobia bacterium]
MADFLLGDAASYTEAADADSGHWNNQSPFAYANDNWHATRRLTLNLGLRWDGIPHTYEADNQYSNFYPNMWNPADAATFLNGNIDPTGPAAGALGPGGVPALSGFKFYLNGVGIAGHAGVPHGMVNGTWPNFGPRIGFAYQLGNSGKTVLRGGFGIMYERIQGNDMYDGALNPPWDGSYNPSNVLLGNPGQNIQTGATFSSSAASIPVLSFTGLSDYYPPPRTYQFSLDVERQLGSKLMLSVGYVGNQDRFQSYYGNYELPPQSQLKTLVNDNDSTWNTSVPYSGFSSIEMAEDGENAYYNSLQVQLRGQVVHNLTLGAAFTVSRSVDGNPDNANAGDLDSLYDPYSWGYTYGPSTYDKRVTFVTNFVYNLPFLMHSPNHLLRSGLGGWELSGVVTANSGSPLNITDGGAHGSNGLAGGVAGTNLPNFGGNFTYPKMNGEWFGTSGFSDPEVTNPGSWGNYPYNSIYGPG